MWTSSYIIDAICINRYSGINEAVLKIEGYAMLSYSKFVPCAANRRFSFAQKNFGIF